MMKLFFLLAASVSLPVCLAAELIWSGSDLARWSAHKNVQYTLENSLGKLADIGVDSSIAIDGLALDGSKYSFISYKYRSNGNTSRSGQLFWTAPGEKFSEKRKLLLPPLKADGSWHTNIARFSRETVPGSWTECRRIDKLRLDLSDNPGGTVEIAEIKLFSSANAPKSAEDKKSLPGRLPKFTPALDAPVWQPVKPEFFPPEEKARVSNEAYFAGRMVRAAEDLSPLQAVEYSKAHKQNPYSDFFLRRDFKLKAKPVKGFMQFVADDSAKAYINGKLAGSVNSWFQVKVLEVTDLLVAGNNVLAFHYRNRGNAGGVLAELFVQYSDGTFERINSDEKFLGTVSPRDDWNQLNAATDHLRSAITHDAPPAHPWVRKLAYKDFSAPQQLNAKSIAPQVVSGGGKVTLTYDFTGRMPQAPFNGDIKIFKGKHLVWEEPVTAAEKHLRRIDRTRWQLQLDYVMPEYLSSNDLTLVFQSGNLCLNSARLLEVPFKLTARKSIPGFEQKCRSRVVDSAYGPGFEVNGKPFFMVSGEDNIFPGGDPPLNAIQVPTVFNEWWTPEDEFFPEAFDRNAESVRRLSPDAYFVMNISLSIPRAWLNSHPDARCLDDRNEIVRDGYGSLRDSHSFGSAAVLERMRSAMIKAINHLENSPYANRIVAYRIVGGHTIEWLGWTPPRGRAVDFSASSRQAFKAFAARHYPELKDPQVPSFEARRTLDDGELVWDPQKHLAAVAHNDYYSNAVVDYVIDLCRTAKKVLNNQKLVGTYYGYTMTLNINAMSQMRAHFALKKLLDARCIDFIMSPQPYNVRNFGDTYGDMKPFASIKKYNIVSLQEDDTRTNFFRSGCGSYQAPNTELCVQILRRNMGFNICRNMPILFISQPGHYDAAQIRSDFRTIAAVGQHCQEKEVRRNARIALVVSEKSIIYSPAYSPFIRTGAVEQSYLPDGSIYRKNVIRYAFNWDSFGDNYTTWARVGAPVDYLLAEDLADNPGDYKLYVFINCQVYDQKFLQAVEKLRKKDCTLLWMYSPGYTYENRNSVENMYRLTRLKFKKLPDPVMPAVKTARGWTGTPTTRVKPLFAVTDPQAEVLARYENGTAGFVRKKIGSSTTYFMGIWRPDLPMLREIAAAAGVKISCTTGDPLEGNDSLIALHARSGGKKSIKLPKKCDVLDVFNKKIIARSSDTFTVELKLHDSGLYYYGDDAAELLKKLQNIK